MKLIKKYKIGDKFSQEDQYLEEEPIQNLYSSINPQQFYKSQIADMQEAGKYYKRNQSARGAAGGNSKANIVYSGGKNPGYWNNPQVKANTGTNWRNTIGPELDKFLGIPYNFGGKEPSYYAGNTVDVGGHHPERKYAGLDCSGFTALFAKKYLGMNLTGSAYDEYRQLVKHSGHQKILKKNGKLQNFVINKQTVLPGDVVYFGNKDHSSRHIGIVHHVNNGKIYLTNAAGNDIAKIVTYDIDDVAKNHDNVFITSLRSDRNYNPSESPLQFITNGLQSLGESITTGIQKGKQFFENIATPIKIKSRK